MADDTTFADLRRLADLIRGPVVLRSAQRERLIAQLCRSLGTIAVPVLGRAVRDGTGNAREAARGALALLADDLTTRARVIDELRTLAFVADTDEAKVTALGLLAELGEHGAAQFSDPIAIQRRSALALASQLDSPGDVANAADLMVRQLDDDDTVQMIEVLRDAAPSAARRLARELAVRLDLDPAQRSRIASIALAIEVDDPRARTPRPTHVAVLVDDDERVIVVAAAKVNGERRWRRWAVLIGESGWIEDCLHEEVSRDPFAAPGFALVTDLCAGGYRIASRELDHARTLVSTAARRTTRTGHELDSAYYLGRDLLDLHDAHILPGVGVAGGDRLERALDLLAAGELVEARALLERLDTLATSAANDDPWIADTAGALGACLLAIGDATAAIAPLERAIVAEPTWPLHHWNLAVATHKLGDMARCQQALRRFVATSTATSGLIDDPAQPRRLAHAEHVLAEIARTARLDRVSARRARKPRITARTPRAASRRKKR